MISGYLTARGQCVEALLDSAGSGEAGAARLDDAAGALSSTVVDGDPGPSAEAIRAYAEALRCLAALERWESDTLAATPSAERHRLSSELRATRAAQVLRSPGPLSDPLRTVLTAIAAVRAPGEHRALRAQLRAVALPVPLIEPGRGIAPPRTRDRDDPPPGPRGAVIVTIAGSPVTSSQAVTPGQVHELAVDARVLDWPEEYDQLTARFFTRWPRSAIEVPDVTLDRPAAPEDEVWRAAGTGHLVLHAAGADPLTPITLAINAELIGATGTHPVRILGEDELAIRTFDPARDVVTGAPVLDDRILDMLAELRESGIAPGEQPALGRFFAVIARAGVGMILDREFPAGCNPVEADFQRELLKRVRMAPELEGRVAKHGWQGGGPTDLVHDGIVAELKIEKNTPVTLEDAKRFLAQTTQYASAGQHQLSILAILDMTPMDAAPGVFANTMGCLVPRLHALDDPAYPSWVAVIIIKANLPRPSDWSR